MASRSARALGPWLVLLVLLGVVAAGYRVAGVHAETTEWALWPSAAPPRIEFDGRRYNRGVAAASLEGLRQEGATSGGAPIFVGPRTAGCAPTGVVVHDGGRAWQYSLSGGPC